METEIDERSGQRVQIGANDADVVKADRRSGMRMAGHRIACGGRDWLGQV